MFTLFLFAILVLGLCLVVLHYIAKQNQRRHDALVELMWLLHDHELCAKGTSIQPYAHQLRQTALEICDEYKVQIIALPYEEPPL